MIANKNNNEQNDNVKCDLHVHLDGNISKENIIKWLENAERNGVKYLSLLEHSNINLYREGSPLQDMIKNGEVEKYYSGKLISGVEMTCLIDDGVISPKTGFDYSGHSIHVTVLNFDAEKAEKIGIIDKDGNHKQWLKEGFFSEALKVNESRVREVLRKKNLPEPPKGYFNTDGKHDAIEKQLYNYWYIDRPEFGAMFDKMYGKITQPSEFTKKNFRNKDSVLAFDNYYYPSLYECMSQFKKIGTVALAHPAYTNKQFSYKDFLETIINTYGNIFDTIEVPYLQNTPEETEYLYNFAKAHNMPIVAGGTDSILTKDGQMYLMMNGEKILFKPNLGNAKKTELLGGKNKGDILLSESDLKRLKFNDIRNQKRFETSYGLEQ